MRRRSYPQGEGRRAARTGGARRTVGRRFPACPKRGRGAVSFRGPCHSAGRPSHAARCTKCKAPPFPLSPVPRGEGRGEGPHFSVGSKEPLTLTLSPGYRERGQEERV